MNIIDNFRWLICFLAALLPTLVQAQQPAKTVARVELGGVSGVVCEHSFSKKWTGRVSAGLMLKASYTFDSNRFYYGGFMPSVGAELRWGYGSNGTESGPFVGLPFYASFDKLTMLASETSARKDRDVSLFFAPGWGYRFPLTERWSVKFFGGFAFSWGVYRYSSEVYVRSDKGLPFHFDVGVSYRL